MTVETLQDLKIGMQVKVKQSGVGDADRKFYMTTVDGSLDFLDLPTIEIPEGTHGTITHIGLQGEIHIKWIELSVETFSIFHSYELEILEFGEKE